MIFVKSSASYDVRMQNDKEGENHIEIPKDIFADIINVDWARMSFFQLAHNQTLFDLLYEATVEQVECPKKDNRVSTTIFDLDSRFQKLNIK